MLNLQKSFRIQSSQRHRIDFISAIKLEITFLLHVNHHGKYLMDAPNSA